MMRIAQLQLPVLDGVCANLQQLETWVKRATEEKADFVTAAEMFSCPYETSNFPQYAEKEGGETWQALSGIAKKYHVYFSAGTVPELDEEGRVYNTAYVFDRDGKQVAKHRKMHLFDIDVNGGQYFKESDTLTAGKDITVLDTEFGKIGLCICYDFRFPELARLMALEGAKGIIVPAAFNMTTGPAHWELMFRSRAVDNQVYVFGTSPARDESASYIAWGHSMAVSPWGEVLGALDEKQGMLIQDIDFQQVDRIRQQLPLLKQRRTDIYSLEKRQP